MIIRLDSATAGNLETARRNLETLTGSWGHPVTETTAATGTSYPGSGSKIIDPVAVATLLLSIPPAALSVLDLADRIDKRRRAQELIDHAQHLTTQNVTITVTTGNHTAELSSLTPDQLLDLAASEKPRQLRQAAHLPHHGDFIARRSWPSLGHAPSRISSTVHRLPARLTPGHHVPPLRRQGDLTQRPRAQ